MVLTHNKVFTITNNNIKSNLLLLRLVQPNPCSGVDGPRPLTITDKGFIMCDGESMFVESCPGGTIWDDLNKACVWPDMQGVVGIGLNEQSQQQSMFSFDLHSNQYLIDFLHF